MKTSLLSFTAILATAVLCNAATVTQSCSTASGTVGNATELHASISCPQFYATGLNSVQINLTGNLSGTMTLLNPSSSTATIVDDLETDFSVGPLPAFSVSNPICSALLSSGPESIPSFQTETFNGIAGHCTAQLQSTGPDLTSYLGVGMFAFGVDTSTDEIPINGVHYFVGGNDIASLGATVTYNFGSSTATPEPSALVLAGIGAAMLLIARSRIDKTHRRCIK